MYLIKNANLIDMAGTNQEIKDILVKDKLIEAVGHFNSKDYPDYEVIDAKKHLVTPGLVDSHCHVGLYESVMGPAGMDVNEVSNPITPELRGIDAVNPHDEGFRLAITGGVTTLVTGPGSANVIGGTFCALKPTGKTIHDMILVEEIAMKMALGENPKRVYGGRNQAPMTRMGTAALLRESLFKAKEYKDRIEQCEKDKQEGKEVKKPDFNLKMASLSRVFDGMLVKIHAHQADDIVTAMRIIEEFQLNATIEHCTEGYLIADTLKKANQRCIIGPTFGDKSKYELKYKSFESARVLKENGILFSIMTDHPIVPLQNTTTQASLFIKEGLSFEDTLKALTLDAAKVVEIDHLVGSIEPGKHADIVIWSGDPFHYLTKPLYVLINGDIALKA